jgi:hypothetical protein
MSSVRIEQKSYEMPPRDGFTVTHFTPPPRGEGPWPEARIELFAKWMADGYQP